MSTSHAGTHGQQNPVGKRLARQRIFGAAVLASLVVVGIAGTSVARARHEVILEIDGISRPVTVWGGTVATALDTVGITPTSNDLVSPVLSERTAAGETIVMRTAHPFDVSIDGEQRTIWTTSSSADTILADAGAGADGASVTMAADRSGTRDTVTPLVSRTRQVAVTVGGVRSEVLVNPGQDVRAALADSGTDVEPNDQVSVTSHDGQLEVTVVKVSRGLATVEVPIPFTTTEEPTDTLFEGESQVATPGVDGIDEQTQWAENHDDQVVSAVPLSSTVTREPTTQVTRTGTKEATPEALVAAGIDPLATLEERTESDGTVSIRYRAKAGSISSASEIAAIREKAVADGSTSSSSVLANTGDDPKGIARLMVSARGWSDSDYQCLVSLWNRESGWNPSASNASSGAYGIPQALPGSKMASAGSDWRTNPATQITWGLGYISGRYGTPCGALSHSNSTGWY